MKIRFDMNAKTAMVYGGAAFLLVIIGFRSIIATLDPDHIGVMTYLSIGGLVFVFCLLILSAQSIYSLGPEACSVSNAIPVSVFNMSSQAIIELTAAVIKILHMGDWLPTLAHGTVLD